MSDELLDNDLLRIKNLNVQFRTTEGVFRAVRDVSISLRAGETHAFKLQAVPIGLVRIASGEMFSVGC